MNEMKYLRKSRQLPCMIASSAVIQVRIDEIRANRAQPRVEFDNNSIIRLADSIRRYGILQPLVVRTSDDDNTFKYELVAGERRLRAARLLGFYSVPCIMVEADEKMSAEMAIIENLLREDLNMFEEAYAFRQLMDNFGMTQEEVARRISLSQSAVANKLRLLKLTFEEQKQIIEYGLTERHARALLKIFDRSLRIKAIEHIYSSNLNVAATEKYIEKLLSGEETDPENAKSNTSRATATEFIASISKKIDHMNRLGETATIDVNESENEFKVNICIAKS